MRRLNWLLVGFASATAQGAEPQPYPTRPIRLMVPTSPGGGTDALARILAPRLGEILGQQLVVDNRSGAAGNIAIETVVRAAPDGYTAVIGLNHVVTTNPSLYKLSYNVEKDLQPVSVLGTAQYILVVHPSVPSATLKDFIALAKQKPGGLNYASAGTGTPTQMAAELFKTRAGVNMVHLAYKGGGPASLAVISGEAQALFGSVASTMPQVRAGKLRGLATTGLNRSKVAPELPTIAESGFPGFDVTSWYAMLVPARTPSSIVNRLHDAVVKSVAMTAVQEAMGRQGLDPVTSTPQELAAKIRAESAVWASVIKEANIRAE